MKKWMPLSVMAAEPSRPPSPSFLSHTGRTWIMGVLNVTPDSFYAGSRASSASHAVRTAEKMIAEGADVLDIGGQSTRPGAEDLPLTTELERVLPVIEALREKWPDIPLSIDTQKAAVAREALRRGVDLINDISALRSDPAMAEVIAESSAPVILMHMQGTPQTMQAHPHYDDVVMEIKRFFEERLAFAARHHIREERIIFDPGIGFGKTVEHNLALLRRLSEFSDLGRPLMVGVSRKSFIGRLMEQASPLGEALPSEERLEGSLAAELWAVHQGARGLRVHDVGATRRVLAMWEGIQSA